MTMESPILTILPSYSSPFSPILTIDFPTIHRYSPLLTIDIPTKHRKPAIAINPGRVAKREAALRISVKDGTWVIHIFGLG